MTVAGATQVGLTVGQIIVAGDDNAKAPSSPVNEALDIAPRDLVLVGSTGTIDISQVATNVKVSRTVDGASAVTVACSDPELKLLTDSRLRENFTSGDLYALMILDGQVFSLVGMSLQTGRTVQLILESDAINRLRKYFSPITMRRGAATMAEFFARLCEEAHVPFIAPDLHKQLPIAKQSDLPTPEKVNTDRQPGIAKHAKKDLTIKGAPIDQVYPHQSRNVETAIRVAKSHDAPVRVILALLVAGIHESGFNDTLEDYLHSGHFGVWQSNQIPGDQVATQAKYFLIGGRSFHPDPGGALKLAKDHPTLTPGAIAIQVESPGSMEASAPDYDKWVPEAKKLLQAFTGLSASDLSNEDIAGNTVVVEKPYQYRRKKGQRSWDVMRELADSVNCYLFEESGNIHFHRGEQLRQSKPRMLVTPRAEGIDEVSFDIDTSPKFDDRVTVKCHMAVWQAPPGSVVDIAGYGPADGRWIVQEISRGSITSTTTTVTLERPKITAPEPANETTTKTVDDGTTDPSGTTITPGGTDIGGTGGDVASPLTKILANSNGYSSIHDGVDLISEPSAPLRAICRATVTRADAGGWWNKGAPSDPAVRGRGDGIIVLRCLVDAGPFKKGLNFGYGHAEAPSVKVGDTVEAGQVIGRAGFANAWHIHFMVNARSDNRGYGDRDPMPYVNYARQHEAAVNQHPRT